MNEIVEAGTIGQDGKMRLPMERVREFFSKHRGSRLLVRFEVVERGTTESLLKYYYGYVLPTVKAAMYETGVRQTNEQTDEQLRQACPVCWKDGQCHSLHDLTRWEVMDFLEWLKVYAAENLYTYIEDPRVL